VDEYGTFLASKRLSVTASGFAVDRATLPPALYDFQRDLVAWALHLGKAALFCNTGLGKTPMQLAYAAAVCRHTGGDALILAPLAVAQQTAREAAKFGIAVTLCRTQADVRPGINIANYERLHLFDAARFVCVVLDESSILKSYDSATRNQLIDLFAATPYKLACTATPAPNDHMELGNHAEFLGVMARVEMLAMFFTHDGGETQKWRLKGHATADFWRWVCSWAVMLRRPGDLGYDDGAFALPPLTMRQHTIESVAAPEGYLFAVEAQMLTERRDARRASMAERVAATAALANADDETWLIWCDLNVESRALTRAIRGAVEVTGSDDPDDKAQRALDFVDGKIRVLVSKPSIFGFGLNFQHCARVAFVGLSDSWEAYYQAIRRCWRYGQVRAVECHVITSTAEGAVVANIERKEREARAMGEEMVKHMAIHTTEALGATVRAIDEYERRVERGQRWEAHRADCVELAREIPADSLDFIVYSPPFASLYTYSNSPRDMGNVRTHDEFYAHFAYLTGEMFRALKPGRLMAAHCMNLPTSKARDGYIGISDFRGDLIRMFRDAGFIFHSEVCIWKDPVRAMQRTKALGLLYKQLRKDSAMSRQGIPDYLIVMRKPGENPAPVTKVAEDFPVDLWQRYASPVWFDINPSDTLQKESAREERDERHIAPLQLEVIRRAIRLWTNPGDLVYDPFGGIGSSGYVAIEEGRRALLSELKESYWRQAVANLRRAEQLTTRATLFDLDALASA
jgi:DNA modification methylase/superfamily II DNA or RNA helicase